MPDHRESIETKLKAFTSAPFRQASLDFLAALGYHSDKTVTLKGSKPKALLDFIQEHNPDATFDTKKALFDDWKSADLLFQLTDEEISRETSLFPETSVKPGLFRSYLFFAIELNGASATNGSYARGKLTAIARQINRVFPMPVMVLIKHTTDKQPVLSIAVINRRQNKRDSHKDVLGKVTIIRDISLSNPHRGHKDILDSFALDNLVHPERKPIADFDTLHAAWEQIFNVELLNNRFYKELSNWYFWALPQVEFPADLEPDDEKRRATGLIRLLTRLIFCWFLKEKSLIPEKLFHPTDLAKLLKGFDPESETSSTYYQAILQNLFFATLNQRMGKDSNGKPYRKFVFDEGFLKNKTNHDLNNFFRYESLFNLKPDDALALFEDIPFLNGGLFECLDKRDEDKEKTFYLDGFSRNAKKRPHVPDRLFFDSGETTDLSEVYGDKKRKKEQVTGLITILNRYKFTIVENTPIDQEIALDPELLGKVFENLLASYNEETKTTARKQTGSFYTPRPIVEYMVDESLKAHLTSVLVEKTHMKVADAKEGLDILFAYTEKEHAFNDQEVAALITAIDEVKIIDPACGSGAFPMGALHKLVYILGKLDPDNVGWERIRIDEAQEIPDTDERRKKLAEITSNFTDNNDDYGRKLYLIENCLYGVDIQPIAIQITKLRFFVSLVCDQKTNRNKKDNHGIRPLPNLETKFVAADTLIGLPIQNFDKRDFLYETNVGPIEKEIATAYHSHFTIQRRDQKLALQKKIKTLRHKLADTLLEGLGANKGSDVAKKAQHLAEWDPFDPQTTADFFDPHWMFGRSLKDGFDIVIGNPPYGMIKDKKLQAYFARTYSTCEGRVDFYEMFCEQGTRLVRVKGGTMMFIIPSPILTNVYSQRLRQLLIDQGSIDEITNFGLRVFQDPTVHNCIVRFTKGVSVDQQTAVRVQVTDLEQLYGGFDYYLPQTELAQGPTKSFDIFVLPALRAMLRRVNTDCIPLADFCYIRQCIKTGDDDKLVTCSPTPLSQPWKPSLRGRSIGRYETSELDLYLKYGDWLARNWQNVSFYETPKLAIRETGARITATIDEEHRYFLSSLYAVYPKNPKYNPLLKPLLAIINSTFATWYVRLIAFGVTEGAFTKIRTNQFGRLPIPMLDNQNPARVARLRESVDEILSQKRDPAADTSALEREIDQQVYSLYGLTPEEIAIVEGTAPWSPPLAATPA